MSFFSVFKLGDHTFSVSMSMFATNRKRLCKKLQENGEVPKGAIVVLQGGEQKQRYCTDTDEVFRQVGNEQMDKNRSMHPHLYTFSKNEFVL